MRLDYPDVMRAIAILTVLWIHSWDSFFIPTDFAKTPLGWTIHQFAHTIGRYGVPLFVMLSGALMLPRQYPNISDFLRSKIPLFLITIVVTSGIYAVFVHFAFDTSLGGFSRRVALGDPIGAYHLWYMYMLVALYIALPFLARMVFALTEREVILLLILTICLVSLPITLQSLRSKIQYIPNWHFFVQTYALYALTGYWLHRYKGLAHWSFASRAVGVIFLLVVTVAIKYWRDFTFGDPSFQDGATWYDSLLIILQTILFYSLIRDSNWQAGWFLTTCRSLAKTSYSTYLWHLLGIYLVMKLTAHLGLGPYFGIPIAIATGLLLGLGMFAALNRTRLRFLVA